MPGRRPSKRETKDGHMNDDGRTGGYGDSEELQTVGL